MCKYLAEFIHFIKQKSLFSTPQNFTKRVHKLFSRRENILSNFENILSSLKNIFSKLENNYVTSIEDFYAVIWGSLYRALRELVPCWKASYFGLYETWVAQCPMTDMGLMWQLADFWCGSWQQCYGTNKRAKNKENLSFLSNKKLSLPFTLALPSL